MIRSAERREEKTTMDEGLGLLKAEPKPVKLGNNNKTGKCGMCGVKVKKLYPHKVGQIEFMICGNCKAIMDM